MVSCTLIVFVHRQYPEGNARYVSRGRSKHDGNQTNEAEQLQDARRGPEFVLPSVSYMGFYYWSLDRTDSFPDGYLSNLL